ncbi:hypothetical protein HELRODRAFT_185629 [Helobdella robusta]|uniref:Dynein axonemal assembly factor 10 n=1 Tax=Helobdella robusta TaxID=6412 RepID=T1FN24_HELRO|nr:hypothetical protein HELRODRAFT_185629 [Helobdella robusta]ESO03705.1 hypothetical protein HELRODRAFT_185629 [Helobdella robusta]
MDKPQIIAHVQHSLNYTLYDCKWIPRSAKFVVLGSHPRGTGALEIFELSQGEVKLMKKAEKPKAFKCGTFGASTYHNKSIATGDFEGKFQIWDLECLESPTYTAKGHKEIINCIDAVGGLGIGEGAPEIVTGSRDGKVKLWDPRQKDDPVAIFEPCDGETKRDCWAVGFGHAFNAHDRCIATGYDNGDLKLFDLRKMALRWEFNLGNGICDLQFDRKDIEMNKLVVTGLESKFHVFDMRTQHSRKGFAHLTEKAHKSTVWGVKHLCQNRDLFVTLGGNGSVNLWKYDYPSQRCTTDTEGEKVGVMGSLCPLQNIHLSTQPISGFDWSPDKLGLAVCTSFDQNLRVLLVTKLNLY